ncbi:phosphatase PAP2 family protein [Emticicia fluvialis]|uniref:phosphatase PAP2 family protein n=1 Tax=Emticicia fluvialis TaxID=2974474 RepID=UPI0021651A53|nr:phosphatase PAP2 family protein [Emticicia fluvialis]
MKLPACLLMVLLLHFDVSAQNFDINVLKNIQSNRNHRLDAAFENFSKSTYPVSAAVPIGMLGVGLITKNKNLQREGLASGAALAVSLGTTFVLKKVIDRPRPYEKYPFINPYVLETDPSFPSGHTTAAFSAATSLSLAVPKWYVIVPAYAWAGTVAYSRLHLGVHYPTDVLVGAVIGAGSAWATHRINRWLKKKR